MKGTFNLVTEAYECEKRLLKGSKSYVHKTRPVQGWVHKTNLLESFFGVKIKFTDDTSAWRESYESKGS